MTKDVVPGAGLVHVDCGGVGDGHQPGNGTERSPRVPVALR